MMPLCTTAIVPVQSTCGCALHSFGAPCVAQRVCAMPTVPWIGLRVHHAFEHRDLALRLSRLETVAVVHGDAGRVVAAIFEALESLDAAAWWRRGFRRIRQFRT